jgi:hypothetical protein
VWPRNGIGTVYDIRRLRPELPIYMVTADKHLRGYRTGPPGRRHGPYSEASESARPPAGFDGHLSFRVSSTLTRTLPS